MAYDFSKISVLLVEDNAYMRHLMRQLLVAVGVDNEWMREASDGEAALVIMDSFVPDLIITDLHMAPMDGLTLIKRIRMDRDNPISFVPIIVCTGHAAPGHIFASRDAGATEFLAKPVSPEAIYERIREVIESPRPFIRTKAYIGPDRRRKNEPFEGEDRRAPAT